MPWGAARRVGAARSEGTARGAAASTWSSRPRALPRRRAPAVARSSRPTRAARRLFHPRAGDGVAAQMVPTMRGRPVASNKQKRQKKKIGGERARRGSRGARGGGVANTQLDGAGGGTGGLMVGSPDCKGARIAIADLVACEARA